MSLAVLLATPPPGCAILHREGRPLLAAARPFVAGEPILVLEHVVWRAAPDAGALTDEHGRRLFDPVLRLIPCRARPNGRLSLRLLALIARRDIQPGEVLTREG